jgi:drug/metabolite transporter (DMT)-like permease
MSPLMLSALLYLGAAIALSTYRFLPAFESCEAPVNRRDLPPICGIVFFGGMLGPILMLFGLQRVSAVTGSLLLNLEGPFTAVIAVGLMREHLGRREMFAAATVMLGGVLVSFQPGYVGGNWIGAVEIGAACLSWGIDNNLTQRVSLRDPVAVARIKTLAAGSCVLVIALFQRSGAIPAAPSLVCAGAVGALCYGVSIVLDVKALRVLGAARESGYFATAPFVGALLSIVVFRELPKLSELAGATLMIIGVAILVRERHGHLHAHERMFHEHLHVHDEHHQHEHDSLAAVPHSHPHMHSPSTHDHPHVSDVHHRHTHRSP